MEGVLAQHTKPADGHTECSYVASSPGDKESYLSVRVGGAGRMAQGEDNYSLFSMHIGSGPVWDLLNHPKIVAAVLVAAKHRYSLK